MVDAVLPKLLEKAIEAGERATVVCPTAARQMRVDESLWTYAEASFLPHGLAGGLLPERQPVLVALPETQPEPARLPLVLAGAEAALTAAVEAGTLKLLYLFDSSVNSTQRARDVWKTLKGHDLTYFAQNDGKWVKKG